MNRKYLSIYLCTWLVCASVCLCNGRYSKQKRVTYKDKPFLFRAPIGPVYFSLCPLICLYVCMYVYLSLCLCVCLDVCLSLCLCVCLDVCLTVCCLSWCLSWCLSVCLSVCLFVVMSYCAVERCSPFIVIITIPFLSLSPSLSLSYSLFFSLSAPLSPSLSLSSSLSFSLSASFSLCLPLSHAHTGNKAVKPRSLVNTSIPGILSTLQVRTWKELLKMSSERVEWYRTW